MILLCCMVNQLHSDRYEVDSIKALMFGYCADGSFETIVITKSEIARPGLDGQPKPFEVRFDEMILENMVYLDARRIGWVFSQEEVDKHWESVKLQNNLSEEDMQRLTAQSGYTVKEAKEQLGHMTAVNQMFDFKVKSGLFITKREVEDYHNAHPEILPAQYLVARAVVPFSDLEPKDKMKARLDEYATTGKGNVRLAWSEPFWIRHDQIALDKQFIYNMKPGDISMPCETYNGFELFKLVDKKEECLVPLKERYDDIASMLKKPKYEQLLDAYKKELYDRTTVVYY